MAALHGWGQAAKAIAECSGVVPVIMVVDGPAVSGPALLLGLADFVVMTAASYAFLSGPAMVAEFTGVAIDNDELGGSAAHARQSGAATLVVPDEEAAELAVRELLAYLPSHTDEEPPRLAQRRPARPPDAGGGRAPAHDDDRQLRRARRDGGDRRRRDRARAAGGGGRRTWSRPSPRSTDARSASSPTSPWPSPARSTSRPRRRAPASSSFCDAFNLPIITLVDTPGFYPGKDLEWRGMIRHGAQLVFAYGRATVARICVILRKSYGGAYIVMDSKRMGNDVCLAWPAAELAVMGAGQAAAILQRRATPEERAAFEADYSARLLNPYVAAERGYVDAVIEPSETRREISRALRMLATKREDLRPRKHDNTPL